MNIIYHHRTQGTGAEGVHIREIIKALLELGHSVRVANPPGINVLEDHSSEAQSNNQRYGWRIISKYCPQIFFELLEIAYNLPAFYRLSSMLRGFAADGIYERYHFFGFAATIVAANRGLPIILEVNEISGIKRIRGQILTPLMRWIERFVFSRAHAIIVVSPFLKNQITSLGVNPSRIHVLPNGINPAIFDPDKADSTTVSATYNLKERTVIGFVGGLVHWHNFDFLLESFSLVRKDIEHLRPVLLFVGDGPLRNDIVKKAEEMNIISDIIITGHVKHSMIPNYIAAMDICIIPHSNQYRSPIKLFEYMALAKPVLAPRVEPIEQVVTDGENVVLFTPEDLPGITAKIKLLLTDISLRRDIGAKARTTVIEKYLWKINAGKIVDMFADQSVTVSHNKSTTSVSD